MQHTRNPKKQSNQPIHPDSSGSSEDILNGSSSNQQLPEDEPSPRSNSFHSHSHSQHSHSPTRSRSPSPSSSSKTPQEPEEQMLDDILLQEKRTYKDKISEELQIKLKALKSTLRRKDEEQTLSIRMHELAISKILVFTHGKTPLLLVLAHAHLGEAYIAYQCFEQAIDHLTIALKKNKKLFEVKGKQYDTKLYHAHILTALGKCYYETAHYAEALEELGLAREYQGSENELTTTRTLTLISNCYAKQQEFGKALQYINEVVEILRGKLGEASFELTRALGEKAKIFYLEQRYKEAYEVLARVIAIFDAEKFNKPELLAGHYETLAHYQEKLGDVDGQHLSLGKIKSIFISIYSATDKRVIKIKRDIAMFLFKMDKHKEALVELNETLDLEEKVYGEASQKVVTTLKVMAGVYRKMNDVAEAQNYLKRARNIEKSLKIGEGRGKLRLGVGSRGGATGTVGANKKRERKVAEKGKEREKDRQGYY